ncbi:hypothetical protein SBC1_74590 (plasmid) [Caballeronia sp. SBC1]|uniref:DUF2934 domain-containing protein n=1 Tax=unclassified Caballeronia TaxID=2646786 RepID=UPI0013E15181|nr:MULTISPECIES: DUF2934 domain-containing protein [unclassified Caballeronia]QIE29094.1 hypothetical protein SBC2_71700 [Caballeronia sp. SBC2]QIN67412.1 hypothetical protein SBC1_74590 [Caballeronia sp. SBC1]
MENSTVEDRIRKLAYELWQEDGEMEGCADEYWRQARKFVEAETASDGVEKSCVSEESDPHGPQNMLNLDSSQHC